MRKQQKGGFAPIIRAQEEVERPTRLHMAFCLHEGPKQIRKMKFKKELKIENMENTKMNNTPKNGQI